MLRRSVGQCMKWIFPPAIALLRSECYDGRDATRPIYHAKGRLVPCYWTASGLEVVDAKRGPACTCPLQLPRSPRFVRELALLAKYDRDALHTAGFRLKGERLHTGVKK